MITYEKVLVLKNVTLFEKASELALSDLISVAQEQMLNAGEVLLEAHQENRFQTRLSMSGKTPTLHP